MQNQWLFDTEKTRSIMFVHPFFFPDSKKHEYTMRVFNLRSTSGSFEATEVLNPGRSEHTTPYPILQSQLYTADQPGKN